jgi:cell division protease FtsH
VSRIIEKAYDRAKELLEDNKDKLTLLAKKLLEKEVIFKDDLEEIFGKRKWKGSDEQEDSISSDALRPDDKQVLRHKDEEADENEKTDDSETKETKSDSNEEEKTRSSENGKDHSDDSEEKRSEAKSDSEKS